MPYYEYEHEGEGCEVGKTFTIEQRMVDDPIEVCPACNQPVFRLMKPFNMSTPDSNTELRDKGFVKLERRDKGVYENVTALDGESRIFDASKPHTAPNLLKRGLD